VQVPAHLTPSYVLRSALGGTGGGQQGYGVSSTPHCQVISGGRRSKSSQLMIAGLM
jgi:hypothetical protein